MTGPDADIAGARLSIHLRRNQFEACRNIINELERQAGNARPPCGLKPIAELPLDLRLVNLLEREGFLYLEQLDGADLSQVRQLGPAGIQALRNAVGEFQGLGRKRRNLAVAENKS